MLDADLAALYGIETKALVRAVKRNADRFPEDFMFQLNPQEFDNLRCQIGTSNSWSALTPVPPTARLPHMPRVRTAGRLTELETAVEQLSEPDYDKFRRWFLERDWQAWDREIETDSASGKLDFLVREAKDAKRSGRLRDI
jgi:hypothetical protein